MWDIIGDIHGEATKLKKLLHKLGYTQKEEYYFHHPKRKVCFLGDYIDRGQNIAESLKIVKTMTERRTASALMGNHEFNYLAFMTKRAPAHTYCTQIPNKQVPDKKIGSSNLNSAQKLRQYVRFNQNKKANPSSTAKYTPIYVRRRNKRHRNEVSNTIKEFNRLDDKGVSFIDWMYSRPIYLETPTFRAIHAAWDREAIKILRKNPHFVKNKHHITPNLLQNFHNHEPSKQALNLLLKGITWNLPPPMTFLDHTGIARDYVRFAWWKSNQATYLTNINNLAKYLLLNPTKAERLIKSLHQHRLPAPNHYLPGYARSEKPLFIGHFWLEQERIQQFNHAILKKAKTPYLLKHNLCCLDFSAAQGGPLVAYRFNGEKKLTEKNFVWTF
ncbi:bis(5'-nucleosyl)-tetraphosphatase PrpE [asymmetrical] [Spirochaetota bacterium]|nr:bis(5'-nucleosyl)-tetraphosphatase PrpE [asymmetrical] [Spirochaetota bacterium]